MQHTGHGSHIQYAVTHTVVFSVNYVAEGLLAVCSCPISAGAEVQDGARAVQPCYATTSA